MVVHWRDSMKSARFFALDARAAFPFMLVLLHIRWWTILVAFLVCAFLWMAERLGLRFDAALRAVRAWFVVPVRPGQAFQLNRRMSDMSGLDAKHDKSE